MNARATRAVLAASLAALALQGCAVGPHYRPPAVTAPPAFREAGDWVPAAPMDQHPRGRWWEAFGDSVLDRLEDQVEVSSTDLAIAEAQYRQALALAGIAHAGLFPTIGADASVTRGKASARGGAPEPVPQTTYAAGLSAAWELDLWGKLRRTQQAGHATAQASAADLESARLSLHALLAQTYFALRTVDADRRVIDRLVEGFDQSLQIAKNQYSVGVVAHSDVDAAEAQLEQARAQGIDLESQRAQLEHALAALMGRFPADFGIARAESSATLPTPPPLLPSELLQRRPDVAAAERRLAASSAEIGVAVAGYFPSLPLTGTAGYSGAATADLFTVPNQVWAAGAALAQTLFDAGRTRAVVAGAHANYDQSLAEYRHTVLAAFQDVEDELAALHVLSREAEVQDKATAAARAALERTLNQYRAGTVSHLAVFIAQATLLNAERNGVDLAGRRELAAVALFKATGGGWERAAN
jgi:NodT family efflux transporter outer membrane factor (OMF) lipoprotein